MYLRRPHVWLKMILTESDASGEATVRPPWGHREAAMRPPWGHHETAMRPPWDRREATVRPIDSGSAHDWSRVIDPTPVDNTDSRDASATLRLKTKPFTKWNQIAIFETNFYWKLKIQKSISGADLGILRGGGVLGRNSSRGGGLGSAPGPWEFSYRPTDKPKKPKKNYEGGWTP